MRWWSASGRAPPSCPATPAGSGGRVADGSGAYYRELLAPQRTLEQDAQGNWVARWSEHGRADHFAHAEVYCRAADEIAARTGWSMWTLG